MKALVIGGGGFLGLYIVEQLVAAGHDLRVFSRSHYPALTALNVESQQGDLQDLAAVESHLRREIDAGFDRRGIATALVVEARDGGLLTPLAASLSCRLRLSRGMLSRKR